MRDEESGEYTLRTRRHRLSSNVHMVLHGMCTIVAAGFLVTALVIINTA